MTPARLPVRVHPASLLLVVAAVSLWLVATTGTSTGSPAPAPSRAPEPAIHLDDQTVWVAPTGVVTAHLRITGAPAGATVQPVLWGPVQTRSAFNASLEGTALPGRATVLPAQKISGSPGSVSFRVRFDDGTSAAADVPETSDETEPPPDPVVQVHRAGVYPLVYELLAADRTTLATLVTYVVRLDTAPAAGRSTGRLPLRVLTVVDATTTPSADHDGRLELTEATRERLQALADVDLDAAKDPPVALRVSPDALDTLDHAKDGPDRTLLKALRTSLGTATPLTTPYVTLDTAAWLADPTLAPIAAELTDRGTTVLEHTLRPPEPVVDFTAFDGGTPTGGDPDTLQWLAARGSSTVLVPAEDLVPLDVTAFPRTLARPFRLALPEGGSSLAAQYDPDLTTHFDADTPALVANHLMGDLAVIALDLPGIERGVVVTTPHDTDLEPATLRATLDALTAARVPGTEPLVTPTSASTFFSTVPTARAAGDTATTGAPLVRNLLPVEAPTSDRQAVAGLDRLPSVRAKVAAFGAMLPGGRPAAEVTVERFERRLAVAASADLDDDAAQDRIDAVSTEIDDRLGQVALPPSQTITLTSRTSSVPLTFRRTADGPTVVRLVLDTESRMRFSGGKEQLITLSEPVTHVDLKVHVDAPGESLVDLRVTSPDGSLLVGESRLRVRSTAVSGIGVFLTFGSLTFLLIWWGRDLFRARRRRVARHIRPADLIDIDPPDDV